MTVTVPLNNLTLYFGCCYLISFKNRWPEKRNKNIFTYKGPNMCMRILVELCEKFMR